MASIAMISERHRIDDLVLRMRAEGAAFQAIADALGIGSREAARKLYERALRRSVRAGERIAGLDLPDDPYFAAWAAGFFDGEGSVVAGIRVDVRGRMRATFTVQAAQTVEAPLLEIQQRYGGGISFKRSNNPKHREQWVWRASGLQAVGFLEDTLPYLRVKGGAAELGLQLASLLHRQGWKVSEEEHAQRITIVRSIQALSTKGRKAKVV